MQQPHIDVRIDKSGKVTVTVSGVSGEACLKLSDAVAQIIGKLESRQLTSEYSANQWHATSAADTRQQIRSRFE
jgi:hypothetical protein